MRNEPFRHLVLDSWFSPELLAQAAHDWPAADWPAWVRYDSPLEKKLACPDWGAMSTACRALLCRLLALPLGSWFGADDWTADASLHGAGLHALPAGGHLDVHLDADRHPRLGLARRANAILFLGDWAPAWGGALEFWTPDLQRAAVQIEPRHGRLVLFETTDASYHGVPGVLRCPPGVLRKSLAAYWWGPPRDEARRPRAQFVATGPERERPDPQKERLRAERRQ